MHVAEHCITDCKSALAVAKALNTNILRLSRKAYLAILDECRPEDAPWGRFGKWDEGFHITKKGRWIADSNIKTPNQVIRVEVCHEANNT